MEKVSKTICLSADEEAGSRLDVFAADALKELNIARTGIQRLIKEGAVTVNGKPSKNSYKLKYCDEVCINIPEARPLELKAENIPLDIKYEDKDMLVVNKPAGMLTHPTSVEKEHTLVNALLFYCKDDLSGINGIMRPGIVHRLDRNTSGLLMIAKNDFAHKVLSEQIKEKTAKRQYLAVVLGNIPEDEGFIDKPLDRHPTQRHKIAVVEGGKTAGTHWKVLERFGKFTFVEAALTTGRTHQIRVHFSYMKHPVAGDSLYGGDNIKVKLNGQALQAYKLTFFRPSDGEEITVEIEPDSDIQKMLKYLRNTL